MPRKKRKVGRPTKMTPASVKKLLTAIRGNSFLDQACTYAGFSYIAYRKWMVKGEERIALMEDDEAKGIKPQCPKQDEPFVQLVHDVNRALAETELALAASWTKESRTDWRAAQALLSVRHKARWSQGGTDHTARGKRLTATIYLPDNGRDKSKEGEE